MSILKDHSGLSVTKHNMCNIKNKFQVFFVDENAVSYTESELILLNVFALILNEVHIYSGILGWKV